MIYEDPEMDAQSTNDGELVGWVLDHCERWKHHRDTNWEELWDEYEKLYRGIWDGKTRESERSKIVSPALQQAIETRHSEIMEAIFGNAKWFDLEEGVGEPNTAVNLEKVKHQLNEDFKKDRVRKAVDQVTLLAEIYGTGIAHIVTKTKKEMRPAMRPTPEGMVQYGVEENDRVSVEWEPVHPRNFLIDPNSTTIEDALGVAIEKKVAAHKVIKGMEDGIYRKVAIGEDAIEDELEPTIEDVNFKDDSVKLLTYYGKVPKIFLEKNEDEEVVSLFEDGSEGPTEKYADLVEAIVVIANDGVLLKAEVNPYMMEDRPVVAYQDETVPGRFWGRGTAEKAYNMQRAIDAQLRLHFDSLALTAVPMVAMDATRLPRGAKFEVKPGKAILTNGNPNEIITPFTFGTTQNDNLATAREMERMLLMATGTIDSAGAPTPTARDNQGGFDMAAAAVIKKYKRTLVNFQEDFLIPALQKSVYRYMQFDPERYPSVDMRFVPIASLGLMAREHEQAAMIRMLSTLGPDSPLVPLMLEKIIKNSSLSEKEELAARLAQMMQPDPAQQQMQQMMQQMELAERQARIEKEQAQAQQALAAAQKLITEAQWVPEQAKAEIISDMTKNLGPMQEQQRNFENRLKLAETALKEKDIDSNMQIVAMQTAAKMREMNEGSKELGNLKSSLSALMKNQEKMIKAMSGTKKIIRDEEGNIVGTKLDSD